MGTPFPSSPTLVRNPKYKPNGTKSYVWAMQKYGIRPRRGRFYWNYANRYYVRRNSNGTAEQITSDDMQHDTMSTVVCYVGGQTMHIDLDTASSDLWVLSTKMRNRLKQLAGENHHLIYCPKESETSKAMRAFHWYIRYGDGCTANGNVHSDTFQIGGIEIKKQAIQVVMHVSDPFLLGAADRVCGLAFNPLNNCKPRVVNTLATNMIHQRDIPADEQVFACYLSSYKDQNEISFWNFGRIEQSVVDSCSAPIEYVPIDNHIGFWMFLCPAAVLNGSVLHLANQSAILDSSTSLLLLDDADCRTIYNAIPGATYDEQQQGYVFPAETPMSAFPELSFAWGNSFVTIKPENFSFADVPDTNMIYGSIQSNENLPWMIMGCVFLWAGYFIFDVNRERLGMAPRYLSSHVTYPKASQSTFQRTLEAPP